MRTSANLSVSSPSVSAPSIPVPGHGNSLAAIAAAVVRVLHAGEVVRQAVGRRRKRSSWSDDLPWDVGMDRLAEQAFPTWIPRG